MLTYNSLKLGKWNLTDLIPDSSSENVEDLISKIKSKVIRFERMRSLLNNDISTEDFVRMIRMIEEISEALSILGGFAHLQYYSNTLSNAGAAFVTKIEKFISEMENRMIFFDLWFKKDLDEANANRLIDAVPVDYREYLRHKRLAAKYSLTEPEEKIITTLEVSGPTALVKIYDTLYGKESYPEGERECVQDPMEGLRKERWYTRRDLQ